MGSEFLVYLQLGFEHISDINGYDHILFIIALVAVYRLAQWKHLLWLVTAFTVGHSITLALATLDLLTINSDLIEFLIPVTILLTSIINIVASPDKQSDTKRAEYTKYGVALGFGLIHGMGFSNFLRALLGAEDSLLVPLFAFNVGLELGQIAILFGILIVTYLMLNLVRMKQREWVLILSGATAGISITMMIDKLVG